jgi:hypothetical protein
MFHAVLWPLAEAEASIRLNASAAHRRMHAATLATTFSMAARVRIVASFQVTRVVVSLSSRVSFIAMSVLVKVVHVPYHNCKVSARKQIMRRIPCFLSRTASNLSLSCTFLA